MLSVKYGESGVAKQVVETSRRQDIRSSVAYFQTNRRFRNTGEPNRALVLGTQLRIIDQAVLLGAATALVEFSGQSRTFVFRKATR